MSINRQDPLKDARHEKFCQLLALGGTQAQAYVKAGFSKTGANANASRLIADDSNGIAERLEWLKSQSATATVMTSIEKREICAAIARGKEKAADRLKAVQVDNDLAEHGADAAAARAIAVVIRRAWVDEA